MANPVSDIVKLFQFRGSYDSNFTTEWFNCANYSSIHAHVSQTENGIITIDRTNDVVGLSTPFTPVHSDTTDSYSISMVESKVFSFTVKTKFSKFFIQSSVPGDTDLKLDVFGSVTSNFTETAIVKQYVDLDVNVTNDPLNVNITNLDVPISIKAESNFPTSSNGNLMVSGEKVIHSMYFRNGIPTTFERDYNALFAAVPPYELSLLGFCKSPQVTPPVSLPWVGGDNQAAIWFDEQKDNLLYYDSRSRKMKVYITSKGSAAHAAAMVWANPPILLCMTRGWRATFNVQFMVNSFIPNNAIFFNYFPEVIVGVGDFRQYFDQVDEVTDMYACCGFGYNYRYNSGYNYNETQDLFQYLQIAYPINTSDRQISYDVANNGCYTWVDQLNWNTDKADGTGKLPNMIGTWTQNTYSFRIRNNGGGNDAIFYEIKNPITGTWVIVHTLSGSYQSFRTPTTTVRHDNVWPTEKLYLISRYALPDNAASMGNASGLVNLKNSNCAAVESWGLSTDNIVVNDGRPPDGHSVETFGIPRPVIDPNVVVSTDYLQTTFTANKYLIVVKHNSLADYRSFQILSVNFVFEVGSSQNATFLLDCWKLGLTAPNGGLAADVILSPYPITYTATAPQNNTFWSSKMVKVKSKGIIFNGARTFAGDMSFRSDGVGVGSNSTGFLLNPYEGMLLAVSAVPTPAVTWTFKCFIELSAA